MVASAVSYLGWPEFFFCMLTWAPLPDFQVSSDASGSLSYGPSLNPIGFVVLGPLYKSLLQLRTRNFSPSS